MSSKNKEDPVCDFSEKKQLREKISQKSNFSQSNWS